MNVIFTDADGSIGGTNSGQTIRIARSLLKDIKSILKSEAQQSSISLIISTISRKTKKTTYIIRTQWKRWGETDKKKWGKTDKEKKSGVKQRNASSPVLYFTNAASQNSKTNKEGWRERKKKTHRRKYVRIYENEHVNEMGSRKNRRNGGDQKDGMKSLCK